MLRSINEILDKLKELKHIKTDTDLAGLFEVRPNTISTWRARDSAPYDQIIALCDREMISIDPLLREEAATEIMEISEALKHPVAPVQLDFPADDFVLIGQVNGKISAGSGFMPDDSIDVKAAFRRDWIKRKGGKPDRMSLIKVAGDSMEPTFLSGDLVLVDHGRNIVPGRGGIFAIAIDEEIMVKRVQPISPDKLLVISDNKQYPPFEVARDQVQINGKVIWFARELEK